MKAQYYKNKNNELYFEPSQAIIERDGLIEITDIKFNELLIIQNTPTLEQELEQKITESKSYLVSTDWYVIRFVDEGTEIPVEVKTKRAEAREFIRSNS